MKTLISVLLILTLVSCSSEPHKSVVMPTLIITHLQSIDNLCLYTVAQRVESGWNLSFRFIDNCGMYLVGDTVVITKKRLWK